MKLRPYARILIDGMDGSGKTTLTQNLVDLLGEQAHPVPGYNRDPDPRKSKLQTWWMERLAENPVGKVVIHDRFFYPEFVYGLILRGRLDMSATTRDYVRGFLRDNAFLIYCRPPAQIIDRDSRVNDQMEGVHERSKDLLIAYDKLMIEEAPYYHERFMRYDWTEHGSIHQLMKRITRYIYE